MLRPFFCIVGDMIGLIFGKLLKPSVTYKVAVNDFMANGGDEYPVLGPGVNTYVLIREYVAEWYGIKLHPLILQPSKEE